MRKKRVKKVNQFYEKRSCGEEGESGKMNIYIRSSSSSKLGVSRSVVQEDEGSCVVVIAESWESFQGPKSVS